MLLVHQLVKYVQIAILFMFIQFLFVFNLLSNFAEQRMVQNSNGQIRMCKKKNLIELSYFGKYDKQSVFEIWYLVYLSENIFINHKFLSLDYEQGCLQFMLPYVTNQTGSTIFKQFRKISIKTFE
jgi:hypothetical protein